jgi:hypothetical protein
VARVDLLVNRQPNGVASCCWWKSADAGSRWPILCGGDDSLGDHLLDRMWVEELAA